jgi:C4-dicarboxylate transporter DctQ subunit
MMRFFSWVEAHFEEVILILTLSAMTILVFGQTSTRFTIGKTPSWTQELAQFLQVYFVYCGASYAIKKKAHIRITLLGNTLPPSWNLGFDIIGQACFLIFCGILIAWGIPLCNEIRKFNQVSAAMQLPMFIPYLAVPLGGVLMSCRLIQSIAGAFRKERGESDAFLNQKQGGLR